MKMNILAFAPYEAMCTAIRDVQKNHPQLTIDIVVGTYNDYLEKSTSIDVCQYDCIFARGYTAQKLKESSIIPVSEIKVSLYDILRVMTMARLRGVPFAILASANILETANQVIDILQYRDVYTCAIESPEEARQRVQELAEQGIQLVVGDVYATNAARQVNIPSILITSSRASIEDAIQDAINNRQQHLMVYEKLNLTSEVIRNGLSSVVVYDAEQNVVLSNLVQIPVTYRQLEKILHKMFVRLRQKQEACYSVSRIGENVLRVTGRILSLDTPYYAFYIQPSKAPVLTKGACIQALYPCEELYDDTMGRAFELPQKLLGPAIALSARVPTVITGGIGTGKTLLVKYLWCMSTFREVPLVVIDCAMLTLAALEASLNDPACPLYDTRFVLLIQNLHLLSVECQQPLCQFLEDSAFSTRQPLVVTSVETPGTLLAQHKLLPRFHDYLLGNHYHIEDLDRRPEDLTAAIGGLINKYNMELGQEVIGFTPDALAALRQFHWSSNMNQLKSVLRQIIVDSGQHYIPLEQVNAVLNALPPPDSPAPQWALEGTLEDIEQRVIWQVLQAENMNYSSAAKRLGISRSTLYRKAKCGAPVPAADAAGTA